MLPGVSYDFPDDYFFSDPVLDLEFDTLRNLEILANDLKSALIEKRLIMPLELLVSHLCAYLGYLTVSTRRLKQATALEKDLQKLIETQAFKCFKLFNAYPVKGGDKNSSLANLEECRSKAPGTIIVQTLRLGRYLFDMSGELQFARSFHLGELADPPTSFFCPPELLLPVFKKRSMATKRDRKKDYGDILLDINQTAIQIGYLMGYYGHMDGKVNHYLESGLPLVPIFIEYGYKFSRMKHSLLVEN